MSGNHVGVVCANYNCPGQLVISGEVAAIDAACEKLLAAGAKRALKLPVGGGFHSPCMDRLCHLGLLKVFRSTLKHQVSDTETENFICFFKERTGLFVVVIQILTHAHKLSTLARKYECFHNQLIA